MKIIQPRAFSDYAESVALFFSQGSILVDTHSSSALLPFADTVKCLGISIALAYMDGTSVLIHCQGFSTPSKRFRLVPAKAFLADTDKGLHQHLLRAIHWLTWDNHQRFCNRCGGCLVKVDDALEKRCDSCQSAFFPNLAPAIMVLIEREDQILLARSAHFKPGMYSAIAGFVDLGETAEAAVHREVKEEVGLEITQLKYFGSQSWPFPGSFMIAYRAQYLRGEITPDPLELEDAQWFPIDNLPELPNSASIARALIESVLAQRSR